MPANKTAIVKDRTRPSMSSARLLASAIASQRIEGLELDGRATADFKALETGSLSPSGLRARLLARYSKTTTSR